MYPLMTPVGRRVYISVGRIAVFLSFGLKKLYCRLSGRQKNLVGFGWLRVILAGR